MGSIGFCCRPHRTALSNWKVMDTPYKESNPSKICMTCRFSTLIDHLGIVPGHPLQGCEHHFFDLGGIVASLQGILNLTVPIPIGNGILLSSFSKITEKLRCLFLGPRNSRCAQVCSLRMARFLQRHLSAEGA